MGFVGGYMTRRITSLSLAAIALAASTFLLAAAPAPKANDTDAILAKMPLFTKDDPWRKDISKEQVDPASNRCILTLAPTMAFLFRSSTGARRA